MHQGGGSASVPGLDGLDLWVWVGLGFARDGGIAGVWNVFLLCCWSDDSTSFLGHPIYPHFLKYSKYSTL